MTDQSVPSTASMPTLPSSLFSRFFGAAQPAWSVLQSNCVMVDQRTSPKRFSTRVTYVIKLSKAYKASSNVLKEMVKLN